MRTIWEKEVNKEKNERNYVSHLQARTYLQPRDLKPLGHFRNHGPMKGPIRQKDALLVRQIPQNFCAGRSFRRGLRPRGRKLRRKCDEGSRGGAQILDSPVFQLPLGDSGGGGGLEEGGGETRRLLARTVGYAWA